MKNKIFRQSSRRAGFTLVELLVVIAIIGILSSVAVVNLNSARDKAKKAAAQANITGLAAAVILCHDSDKDIVANNTGSDIACGAAVPMVVGKALCDASGTTWPSINATTGWDYVGCTSVKATGAFTIVANSGTDTITCNQAGCS